MQMKNRFFLFVYQATSFARQDLQSRLAGEPGAALLMCLISDHGARLMYWRHPVKAAVTCIPMLCRLLCRRADQVVCRSLKWLDPTLATPAASRFRSPRLEWTEMLMRAVFRRYFLHQTNMRMQYLESPIFALLLIGFCTG